MCGGERENSYRYHGDEEMKVMNKRKLSIPWPNDRMQPPYGNLNQSIEIDATVRGKRGNWELGIGLVFLIMNSRLGFRV